MLLEYRPSRRSNAPLAPESVSPSYSSKMASLYWALNRRRAGLAPGSPSGTPPSWARAVSDAVVMVTVLRDPVSPRRDGGILEVSHVSLTDRGVADKLVSCTS